MFDWQPFLKKIIELNPNSVYYTLEYNSILKDAEFAFARFSEDSASNPDEVNDIISQIKQAVFIHYEKEKKLRQTAVNTITLSIKTLLKETDYEWSLTEEDERSILHIRTKFNTSIDITLGHKTFTSKIPELLTVIGKTLGFLDKMPYSIYITNCKKNITWNRGKHPPPPQK